MNSVCHYMGLSQARDTVKPIIFAALNFGSLVY